MCWFFDAKSCRFSFVLFFALFRSLSTKRCNKSEYKNGFELFYSFMFQKRKFAQLLKCSKPNQTYVDLKIQVPFTNFDNISLEVITSIFAPSSFSKMKEGIIFKNIWRHMRWLQKKRMMSCLNDTKIHKVEGFTHPLRITLPRWLMGTPCPRVIPPALLGCRRYLSLLVLCSNGSSLSAIDRCRWMPCKITIQLQTTCWTINAK